MAGTSVPATGAGWNTAVPDNSQPHGNDYNEHRETKLAVGIRMAKEHVDFAADSVGGEHKAGSAVIYIGDYSDKTAGDDLPTTKPDGSTALDSDDAGRLAYDTDGTFGGLFYKYSGSTWEQVPLVALTGAQTIEGVKTFSSFPLTPEDAPEEDYQVANVKFVNDNSGAANWTPTAYAGEESITFPNGLIMKMGYKARSGRNTVLAFDTAFPNACIVAMISPVNESEHNISYDTAISDKSKTGFDINNSDNNVDGYYWWAIGR